MIMTMTRCWHALVALAPLVACAPARQQSAQPAPVAGPALPATAAASVQATPSLDRFAQQQLFKRLTDLSFITQLSDEMTVKKVEYSGADKMTIPAYFFAPRDTVTRRPVVIMVHGGVHGDLSDLYVPHVRSLVNEGYIVVAPEYRGSTGYGRSHYDAIDYGGKEVEDVIAARQYLADLVPNADLSRVAMIGWSHGGFITLHSIFRRPELFTVAVAHVPVSDLPTRIRTHSAAYAKIFSDQPGFGGTLAEKPQTYIDRSPIAHARKLKTPLLVHAASNDDDVFIIENHNLRDSMVAAGKDKERLYTYREWQDPPGGHAFSRVDTKEGRESWSESLAFLRKYLRPGSMKK